MSMTLISTVTVGAGGAASIDFTSIPQTFTDLYLFVNCRTIRAANVGDDIIIRLNSDSGANYSYMHLLGTGSATASGLGSSATFGYIGICPAVNATANTFGSKGVYIPNYSGSTAKSFSVDAVSENNGTESYQFILANLWTGTAAINSISVFSNTSSNFVQYSTASLYGILKGSGGATVS